jgi:hypothetical protein
VHHCGGLVASSNALALTGLPTSMLHKIRTICIAFFVSGASMAAFAEQMTVDDLQQICSGRDTASQNACRFYILGVVEGASVGTGRNVSGRTLCIAAEEIPSPALADAVKQKMRADLIAFPEDKSLAASGFVIAAAMKSYPCNNRIEK